MTHLLETSDVAHNDGLQELDTVLAVPPSEAREKPHTDNVDVSTRCDQTEYQRTQVIHAYCRSTPLRLFLCGGNQGVSTIYIHALDSLIKDL